MVRKDSCFLCNPEPELARAREPYHQRDLRGEISPMRITGRKQGDLLFSAPFFDLLLTIGGNVRVVERFKVHQPIDLVFSSETIEQAILMFLYSLPEIVSKTSIQSPAET